MPETEDTAQTETATTETETPAAKEAETVDWKAKAREWEKRAKTNADAALKLAAFEDAQKTEAQRWADAAEAAKAEAAEAKAETLRYRIATQYGINSDDAETFLTGTDEETVIKQAERLAVLSKSPDAPTTAPAPRPDLSQGARAGNSTTGDPAQDFARFITRQLSG